MIAESIQKLVDKQDLSYQEAYDTICEIMSGQTTAVQTAAFLAALSTKSTKAETIDEIAGCATAMRTFATPLDYPNPVLEIVGTGGDKAHSFDHHRSQRRKSGETWQPCGIVELGRSRLPGSARRQHRAGPRAVLQAA